MNNKGQAIMVGVMLAAAILVTLLGIIGTVNNVTTLAQNTTSSIGGMDCSNSSISDYTKAGCLVADISTPYFFAAIVGIAGLAVIARYGIG